MKKNNGKYVDVCDSRGSGLGPRPVDNREDAKSTRQVRFNFVRSLVVLVAVDRNVDREHALSVRKLEGIVLRAVIRDTFHLLVVRLAEIFSHFSFLYLQQSDFASTFPLTPQSFKL